MKDLKYTYRVSWSAEDREHVGTCAELPSLSHLALSEEGALRGIKGLVRAVVLDMKKHGEQPPEPLAARAFSGQFKVRIPPDLHRALAIEAAENEVSLNRWVSLKLAKP